MLTVAPCPPRQTHTILGGGDDGEAFDVESPQCGLLPRVLKYLFKHISLANLSRSADTQTLCQCSFLEIYNEQVFDLLTNTSENLQVWSAARRAPRRAWQPAPPSFHDAPSAPSLSARRPTPQLRENIQTGVYVDRLTHTHVADVAEARALRSRLR